MFDGLCLHQPYGSFQLYSLSFEVNTLYAVDGYLASCLNLGADSGYFENVLLQNLMRDYDRRERPVNKTTFDFLKSLK